MQTVTVEDLQARLRALPTNPRVVVSGNTAIPWEGVRAVDGALERYIIHALNAPRGIPDREGVTAETCFVGPGMRHHPQLHYVPSRLSLVPLLFARTLVPDVVLVHCTPPQGGHVSLGLEVNILPAAIDSVRAHGGLVVAVLNRSMPRTSGDALVPVEYIDLAIEVDEPLPTHAPLEPDDESRLIGERVAAHVRDGSTLQLGIGGVPDATLGALTGRRGLRMWTEMFSDGVLALDAAGALDQDHPLVTSFCFGSAELYEWIHDNPRVRMLRTEKTNDPGLIAQQRHMTSVNTALEVDLFGQANASRINARIHSGFGGQTDFIVGALHSQGGQSFIALRSWHPKADVSTIVPLLDEPVTSFQQSAVVTEHGMAQLWGRSEREQCHDIIEECAHPRVRDDLREEAHALGLG
ncbi:acetyl-CoA hydrolase/transferase family protein [Humibacillus xanthopallidus]|uniref:acetyl-CoA hydrolase/transferase family protein n=1 Tax=Humibacillus xanthopallidus TaxID=412689 RepID=UPI001152E3BE|nr:acetyl-CoA hydrolase/transferase C-terminal domain-containing protein [Humibacillus xanthopallidus]